MTFRIYSDLATPGSDWERIDAECQRIQKEHPRMGERPFRAALVNKAIMNTVGRDVAEFRRRRNQI
jgi:hypothetical protein